jgi:hypothetical protein
MSLHPIIYALERMAGELRERACRLDDAARDLKRHAPRIPTPAEFTVMSEGRLLSEQEKFKLVEMAQARGTTWTNVAALVMHYADGMRLVEILKQIPKQETLTGTEPEPVHEKAGHAR